MWGVGVCLHVCGGSRLTLRSRHYHASPLFSENDTISQSNMEPIDTASLQIAMGSPLVSIFLELDLQVNATPIHPVLHTCPTALNSSPCACMVGT